VPAGGATGAPAAGAPLAGVRSKDLLAPLFFGEAINILKDFRSLR
jgi:hypothetical protein